MIDAIDNIRVLNVLREEATFYILETENDVAEDPDNFDVVVNLSLLDLADLKESIAEVDRVEVVTYEELKTKMKLWLAK